MADRTLRLKLVVPVSVTPAEMPDAVRSVLLDAGSTTIVAAMNETVPPWWIIYPGFAVAVQDILDQSDEALGQAAVSTIRIAAFSDVSSQLELLNRAISSVRQAGASVEIGLIQHDDE